MKLNRSCAGLCLADTMATTPSPSASRATKDKPSKVIGQVLSGSYQVQKLIGEGGMGAVYEATHVRLPRRLAVKVLDLGQDPNPETMERFKQEAWITNDLKHPHIVNVCDFNKTPDGTPYFVMELLDGEDLESRLKRIGRFALDKVASILTQTASALEAAHNRGVVHRDLKPQNLYLVQHGDESDHVKILDFGISKVKSGNTMTQQRTVIGTPYYMSPEQARGLSSMVDRRTDVFAMGVLLYEMIAGVQPFVGNSAEAILYQVVHEDPTPLSELRAEVNRELEAVVSRAMAKSPEDRFPGMKALALAFVKALGQEASEREAEEIFMLAPDDLELIEELVSPDDDTKPDMEYEIEPVVAPFSGTLPGQGAPRAPREVEEEEPTTVREQEPDVGLQALEDGAVVTYRPYDDLDRDDAFDEAPTRAEKPGARAAEVPWPSDDAVRDDSLEDLPLVQLPPVAVSTPPPIPDDAGGEPSAGGEPGAGDTEGPPPVETGRPRELMATMQVRPIEQRSSHKIELSIAAMCGALVAILGIIFFTSGSGQVSAPAAAHPSASPKRPPVVENLPAAASTRTREQPLPPPAVVAEPAVTPAVNRSAPAVNRSARRGTPRPQPSRPNVTTMRRVAARPDTVEPDSSDWVAPGALAAPEKKVARAAVPLKTGPAAVVLKVPRAMRGDAAKGRSLFRSGCGRCHGKTAPRIKPTRHTSRQWSRFFARGKHRRQAPLAPHFRLVELSHVKAHLMANAADSGASTTAGIR